MVNILVAEDDKDDYLLLEEAIETVLPDFEITRSRNGKELLQHVGGTMVPDLIFLDLNMPKINGRDCLVAIRQQKHLAATPVIIYSTSSDFEDIDSCYKNGCTLYLVKQPSFKGLQAELRRVLSHDSAREALQKAEEKFSLFLKVSSEQVFRMSADWKKMFVLGGKNYLTGTEQTDSSPFQKNIHPGDQPLVMATIQKAISTRSMFELEYRVIRKDHSIKWMFTRAVPMLGHDGVVMEWIGTASDITARKSAEQELKEEHYFLEQITDNTPHLIYVYDLDEQRFIYVNRRIQEIAGITQDDVYSLGPHVFKLALHPDDIGKRVDHLNHLASLKIGDIRENEFRLKVGDSYRWFRSKDHIFKTEGGRVKQVIGLSEEITYEKRLQEVLVNETGGVGLN
jgi:PAS domain S-box-containing protein